MFFLRTLAWTTHFFFWTRTCGNVSLNIHVREVASSPRTGFWHETPRKSQVFRGFSKQMDWKASEETDVGHVSRRLPICRPARCCASMPQRLAHTQLPYTTDGKPVDVGVPRQRGQLGQLGLECLGSPTQFMDGNEGSPSAPSQWGVPTQVSGQKMFGLLCAAAWPEYRSGSRGVDEFRSHKIVMGCRYPRTKWFFIVSQISPWNFNFAHIRHFGRIYTLISC